jgi:hypothetical protein
MRLRRQTNIEQTERSIHHLLIRSKSDALESASRFTAFCAERGRATYPQGVSNLT